MVRKGTELESSVVSVERVKEYSETEKEVFRLRELAVFPICNMTQANKTTFIIPLFFILSLNTA